MQTIHGYGSVYKSLPGTSNLIHIFTVTSIININSIISAGRKPKNSPSAQ